MKLLSTNKDKKKLIRSIIQAIILLAVVIVMVRVLFVFNKYKPYDSMDTSVMADVDNGFISLSYFAVDRDGSATMISTDRLREHLNALYKNGYVTITQKDIENYYKNGTPLPKKSLFLMFEDGRRDTAIFSGKILEEYNYIATILSYADKFGAKDSKFLSPKDLSNLKSNTFWELGTNGYRLSYINAYDRYGHYIGELNSLEYSSLRKYLDRNYNQYLMDFIRDENKIPKETYDEMKERISKDYKLMDEIYTKEFGKVPDVYVLMHSNTGNFANNEKVSAINEEWMKKLFVMNFNREGFSLNNQDNHIYDLTRMQPQPYWYPNHLLMRIANDTLADVTFEEGDPERKKDWEILAGAPEFRNSVIALTSESKSNGLIRLKDSKAYQDVNLSVNLTGNKLGTQTIYLRADEELNQYVSVKIQNNNIYINENGVQLFELDLNELDGIKYQSVEENEREAHRAEYETYSQSTKKLLGYTTNMEKQIEPVKEEVKTVEEGADKYIPSIQINEPGNRQLTIKIQDNQLSVFVDQKKVTQNLSLSGTTSGYIYLESAWSEYGYSQRNIADDVYDGVFQDLLITDAKGNILYDNQLQGWAQIKDKVEHHGIR